MSQHNLIILILAICFGSFMLWSVGANALANIMSTALGSKTITVKQAIVVAIVFETAGAVLGGHGVAKTVQSGIINMHLGSYPPEIFICGLLAVILASASWMAITSRLGFPVSITACIVGSLVGFGLLAIGLHAVHWHRVGSIALVWLISPFIAALLAYLLFLSIQFLILVTKRPAKRARQYIGLYLFLVNLVLVEIVVINILFHFGIHFKLWQNTILALVLAYLLTKVINKIYQKIPLPDNSDHHAQFGYVEKLFGLLMLLATCAMVYAHGSNDIAISAGPVAAIFNLITTGGTLKNGLLNYTMLTIGAVWVVIGLLTYGRKIIANIGSGITVLTPSRAYCATISAAIIVIISTSSGIPISAGQILVGAILGVGLARGIGALDLKIMRNIFITWVITVPVAAVLAILFFDLIRMLV